MYMTVEQDYSVYKVVFSDFHKTATPSKKSCSSFLFGIITVIVTDSLFQSTGSVEPSPSPSPGSLSAALNIAAAANGVPKVGTLVPNR